MSRILAVLIAVLALDSPAASVGSEYLPFEPVNLTMTVDSCAFVPSSVHVTMAGNTLRVTQQPNACLVPGSPELFDVRLGAFPAGNFRVELYASPDTTIAPVEAHAFSVREPAEIAVFPPPPRPLTDYSGLWWNPAESGWGLSLHQNARHRIFGTWLVYDASNNPVWYTLQAGQWTSATTWTGRIYRTSGPFFGGPDFDPRLVLVQAAGSATLDFRQVPGEEGRARFTSTIGGVTATKTIRRQFF